MTLNEIIESIKEIKEDYWEDDGYGYPTPDCQRITTALDEAIDRLELTRWIPASEGLPKKSGKYWCTFGGTYNTGVDFYTTEEDAKEDFEEPEEYVGWSSQNVIAWMSMPKHYEPENEGGMEVFD